MIRDIIDYFKYRSVLITRPRRFGKSLALSMIDYFFTNKADYSYLFKNKKIWECGEKYTQYANSFPVIHLNMKDLSKTKASDQAFAVIDLIADIYRQNIYLLEDDKILDIEKKEFLQIANKELSDLHSYSNSIKRLSDLLCRHFSKRVIILIDEYDTPINAAYQYGYYDESIAFFKGLYSSALKGNDSLYFSIVTGVLEISKESIFSELNNLDVYSVVDEALTEYFGFTMDETKAILQRFSINEDIEKVRAWYGGYGTKTTPTLNPWSVLNFVNKGALSSYWVNTGQNSLIGDILNKKPNGIESLNEFLSNQDSSFSFLRGISYKDLSEENALFSLLVQSGYLSASHQKEDGSYALHIPNLEIQDVFEREIIARNVSNRLLGFGNQFKEALKSGDVKRISEILEIYVIDSFSYLDLTKEKDYQILLTSLLAVLFGEYVVKSEVNSSRGRCDILISPKEKTDFGMVIELKKIKGRISEKRFAASLEAALNQIKEHRYYNELIRRDCEHILLYAFAFDDTKNQVSFLKIR